MTLESTKLRLSMFGLEIKSLVMLSVYVNGLFGSKEFASIPRCCRLDCFLSPATKCIIVISSRANEFLEMSSHSR